MTFDALIRLILVLIATGAIALLVAVVLTAVSLLRPPRMTDGKAVYRLGRLSPGDLGLEFQETSFDVGVRIAAWWIPANDAADTVILIHGYADAKVGSIAWAPTLHAIGLNVLAIDLRRHGESGGAFSTGGCLERADVSAVIDQLRQNRPSQTRRIVLFGVSTGAAVAAAVAADRNDIAAMVLESPFTDFRSAVSRHARLAGMPGGGVLSAAVWLAQVIARVDFRTVRPVVTIPKAKCPVLAIVGTEDALLTDADRDRLRDVVGGEPNQYWLVPNAPHLLALHTDPVEYRRRLEVFLRI